MRQNIHPFLLILHVSFFCYTSCGTVDTETSVVNQEKKVDSLCVDSPFSDVMKDEEKIVVIPISPEKVEEQIKEILEEPEKIVNKETNLKAEELVIEKDYDIYTLKDAFNQLKPSLTREAQRVVMNTIQMDFSDTKRKGVVKGTFMGEANEHYSIRSYMNRLTMVGPFKISVTNLVRDKSGKIISVTLKEIENLNS